jgi:Holliday junction resolvasome RuvABC endonuclease subunit
MANVDKKKAKLKERIEQLETELHTSLQKKTSNVAAINVPAFTSKIRELKDQLAKMA